MWSKGVFVYDSRVCCFKEVKTAAKIVIILAFSTRNTSKHESIGKYIILNRSYMHCSGPLPLTFEGLVQGFWGKNCQNASRGGKP